MRGTWETKMPNWKKHILLGIVFVIAIVIIDWKYLHFLKFGSWKNYVLFIPILIFYAMLPDIDHRISQPRLIATVILGLATAYFILFGSKLQALFTIVVLIATWTLEFVPGFDHRGHLHSIIAMAALSVPLYWIGGLTLAILGFLFALSHLLADRVLKLW